MITPKMGCSASVAVKRPCCPFQSKSKAAIAPETLSIEDNEQTDFIFTAAEKAVVIKTWRVLSNDLTGRGTKVFIHIFRDNPKIKDLFPLDGLDGEAMVKSYIFKGHASRFMQAVGAVVDNIDSCDEALSPLLIGLGKHHVLFTGFKPDYFNSFETAMRTVWAEDLGSKFTPQTEIAWTKVFKFILRKLKEGYLIALDEYESTRNPTVSTNVTDPPVEQEEEEDVDRKEGIVEGV